MKIQKSLKSIFSPMKNMLYLVAILEALKYKGENKMSFKIATLIFALTIAFQPMTSAQIQLGTDIDGEAAGDESGWSVSMPDANTLAIGASWNDGSGSDAGHVRIYSWTGTKWIQKGKDIDGEAADDYSGWSVSMPDANTVAIGAHGNDGNETNAGHVRIYSWNGTTWIQKGTDIDGEAAFNASGGSVSMPDGNTVAIGAPFNDGSGSNAGHVRIYSWNGTSWIQKGTDIDGEAADDWSGSSVSMPDANTLSIGAPGNDESGSRAGHVRIYSWNGTNWIQKGADIDGEVSWDNSGKSVSMPDVNTVAIGAPENDGSGTDAGHVRVYSWNGTNWIQKGTDIDGEAAHDRSGWAVRMADANTVAIGAHRNNGNGFDAGHVRIYSWNGTNWIQNGTDINGGAAGDNSGYSVSMPNANTVAIGAPLNSGSGAYAGHVRVYSLTIVSINQTMESGALAVFPNPVADILTIEINALKGGDFLWTLTDMTGKTMISGSENLPPGQKFITIETKHLVSGMYLLKSSINGKMVRTKIIKTDS